MPRSSDTTADVATVKTCGRVGCNAHARMRAWLLVRHVWRRTWKRVSHKATYPFEVPTHTQCRCGSKARASIEPCAAGWLSVLISRMCRTSQNTMRPRLVPSSTTGSVPPDHCAMHRTWSPVQVCLPNMYGLAYRGKDAPRDTFKPQTWIAPSIEALMMQ